MSECFEDLLQLIKTLRGPKGCPWDKKQDIQSIKKYILEEAYELLDAIISADHDAILEEAGDLLFQILFLIELEHEAGFFTIEDVINATKEKMIRRHPHVFGDTKVSGISDVLQNWEKIKQDEKSHKNNNELLIPISMPGSERLLKAFKLAQKKGLDPKCLLKVQQSDELKEKISNLNLENLDTQQLQSLLYFFITYSYSNGLDIDKNLREFSEVILQKINSQNKSTNKPDYKSAK